MSAENHEKEWAIMVYMIAGNNLGEEIIWALTEMQGALSSQDIGLVALFDSNARGVPTKKYSFTNSGMPVGGGIGKKKGVARLKGETFEPEVDSNNIMLSNFGIGKKRKLKNGSDPRLLEEFLNSTLKQSEFRAKRHMIVLSGHGSGAIGDFLPSDQALGSISISNLAGVLDKVREYLIYKKIDILGMDSCLMSMAEVCYDLRTSVNFLVGTEGLEPATGWPYAEILATLDSNSKVNPRQLAISIANEYISFYSNYVDSGVSVDIAVCQPGKMENLVLAIRSLASTLTVRMYKEETRQTMIEAIVAAHWKAQSYKQEKYTDLWDFCDLLGEMLPDLQDECKRVKEEIDTVVITSQYYGAAFQHSHGLSVYFPWKHTTELDVYKKLPFAIESGWGDFLEAYVDLSRREMRGESRLTPGIPKNAKLICAIPTESPIVIPLQSSQPDLVRTPPDDGRTPPDDGRTPPDDGRTPPDDGRTPPDDGRGIFLKRTNMKNSPDCFLVEEKTGNALT